MKTSSEGRRRLSSPIVWYLADDPRLGDKAATALDEAVDTDGVSVGITSLGVVPILWWTATATRTDYESRAHRAVCAGRRVALTATLTATAANASGRTAVHVDNERRTTSTDGHPWTVMTV